MASIFVLAFFIAVVGVCWRLGYQERQRIATSPYIGCDKHGRSLQARSGFYAISDGSGYNCSHSGWHGGDCGGDDGGGGGGH